MPRKPTRHKPSGSLKLVQQLTRAGTGQVYTGRMGAGTSNEERWRRELVELSGIELEPLCGRLSPQAKS
jgi:hypothetical protein